MAAIFGDIDELRDLVYRETGASREITLKPNTTVIYTAANIVELPEENVVAPTATTLVSRTSTDTLTNKTLTSPILTTPKINDTSADHTYDVAVSELAADRTITLPLLTTNDEFTFNDHPQTLASKTLTLPKINDSVTDHTYTFAVANLAADRTVTLPLLTSGDTFVFEAHAQTLTNKTIDGDDNTIQDLAISSIKTEAGSPNVFISRDGSGIPIETKAVPTGTVVGTTDAQTLTTKTLTSPTISNFALYDNEAETRWEEGGGGSDYLAFKAPTAVTSTTTFTLPDGPGTAGQVLSTDGTATNATLSWASAATNALNDEHVNIGNFGGTATQVDTGAAVSDTAAHIQADEVNGLTIKTDAIRLTAQFAAGAEADASNRGVVSITSQTFAGDKTFDDEVIFDDLVTYDAFVSAGSGSSTATVGQTFFASAPTISTGHTMTIDSGALLVVAADPLTVDGTLIINGDIRYLT
jgi:hypothetical protein